MFVCRYDESLWENIDLTRKTLAYDGTLGAILHRGALSLRLSRTNVRYLTFTLVAPFIARLIVKLNNFYDGYLRKYAICLI